MLSRTIPRLELKMSKRRLRGRRDPTFGLSVPVCCGAVVLTLYFIAQYKYETWDDAVYQRPRW